ncbi:hypothetical protein FACS1894122_04100 [Alphaproteobacteria bacterium]|nr:hypothetical protein FACS1894122_04100 [Alphaproteobacteria bacterium]
MKNNLLTITSLLCSVCILAHSEAAKKPVEDAENAVDVLISNKSSGDLSGKFDNALSNLTELPAAFGYAIIEKCVLKKLSKGKEGMGEELEKAKIDAPLIIAAMRRKYCVGEENSDRDLIDAIMNCVGDTGSDKDKKLLYKQIAKSVGRVTNENGGMGSLDVGTGTLIEWGTMPPELKGNVVITAAHNVLNMEDLNTAHGKEKSGNDYEYVEGLLDKNEIAIVEDLGNIPSIIQKKEKKEDVYDVYFIPNSESGFNVVDKEHKVEKGRKVKKVCFFRSGEAPWVEDYALLILEDKKEGDVLIDPVDLDFKAYNGTCSTVGLGGIFLDTEAMRKNASTARPQAPRGLFAKTPYEVNSMFEAGGYTTPYFIYGSYLKKATEQEKLEVLVGGAVDKMGLGDSGSPIIVKVRDNPEEYKMVGVFGFPSRLINDINAPIQLAVLDQCVSSISSTPPSPSSSSSSSSPQIDEKKCEELRGDYLPILAECLRARARAIFNQLVDLQTKTKALQAEASDPAAHDLKTIIEESACLLAKASIILGQRTVIQKGLVGALQKDQDEAFRRNVAALRENVADLREKAAAFFKKVQPLF